MPELPEVETIRRQLAREVKGSVILSADVRFGKRLNLPADRFAAAVRGARIQDVGRRAKLLVFTLSNGWTMVAHLKMTGRFLLKPEGAEPTKHTHVVFHLSGRRQLFFEDVRKFGFIRLFPSGEVEKAVFQKEKYGPEPLEPSFGFDRFAECLMKRASRRVKPSLMDQTCIAGIGNIYADESLWRAGVRPDRRISSLSPAELRKLYRGILTSFRESIKHHGTSADMYVDLYGRQGTYVRKLRVYGREGQRCYRCGGRIVKVRMGGRGTHFCPKCQK